MKQVFTYLVLLLFVALSINVSAQRINRSRATSASTHAQSAHSTQIWTGIALSDAPSKTLLRGNATEYLVYKLSVEELKAQFFALSTSPENGVVFNLPMPDGSFRNFKVWQTPMMPDALAAMYPSIKTFSAEAVNDKNVTAKLDFTEFGFHAAFYDGESTSLIDPYDNLNDGYYIVYYKRDVNRPFSQRVRCATNDDNQVSSAGEVLETIQSILPATDLSKLKIPAPAYLSTTTHDKKTLDGIAHEMASLTSNGTTLRTYRLALSANHFYCQAATGLGSPTIGQCFSAMTTTMNRVNGVYNREIAVQLNFCTNENLMIWPIVTGSSNGTDPFDAPINSDAPTCLTVNQTTCDTRIGSANYDIGHVFTTGAGGLASLGIVCNASFKAQGVTGSSSPVGDNFDIDYVCHEMGHQFGSSHTFNNNVDGACSTNASPAHAYEPASGATIMDYAGICSPDNIQAHSAPYFSANSLEQIQTHITGSGGTCAVTSSTGHPIPVMTSTFSATYNIPYKTPFEFGAPAATVGAMDTAVTYGWYQSNLGDFGLRLNQTYIHGPIFRSYQPAYGRARIFPQLSTVLAGALSNSGEKAPDTTRILTFKTVVRNVFNGYGCFTIPDDTIHVNAFTTGPANAYAGFRVTSQGTTGIIYTGGTTQTVTWNVVGTNAVPVNATNVDIYMSTDGGNTWAYTVGTFPNTGTASITVPNPGSSTSTARFKVKGSGNIFFNINSQNFTVNPGAVTAPITGTFTVCVSATTTLADVTPAGTWSSSTPSVATVGSSSGIVTGVTAGTSTITYTAASGPVTAIVTIIAAPATPAAIAGSSTVCTGNTTLLTDATPGGTWASSNIARATVDASGNVTGVSAGTLNITYTVSNACGSAFVIKAMTVSAPVAVAPITGTLTVCQGSTTPLSDVTPGGVWSSTNPAVGTISASGVVAGITAGTTTISYSITAGCTSAATAIVTVNSTPVATTTPTGAVVICTGGSVVITASPVTAGFTYQWQDGGINIGGATSTTFTASAAGNFRVLVTNTVGCVGTSAVVAVTVSGSGVVVPAVTVNAAPGTNICSSVGAVTYTATSINGGGAPTYQWYVNGTPTGGPGATFAYTPANGDIVKCRMTSSLPCAVPTTAADSVTMTVTTVATPSVSISPSPNDTVCIGNSATYTAVPSSGGASPSYSWTVNGMAVATGPSFTNTPANGDIVMCQMTSTATCITTPVVTSAPLVMTVQSPVTNTVTISTTATTINAGDNVTFVAIALNAGPSPAYQWFISGVAVAGATNVTFTTNALTNGQVIHCKVTTSLPCVVPHIGLSDGIIIHVITTGVWEITKGGNAFALTPNPNRGTFTITGKGTALQNNDVIITVTNVLGQHVYNSIAAIKNGHMDETVTLPAGTPAGTYLVSVTSGTERIVFRMVLDK